MQLTNEKVRAFWAISTEIHIGLKEGPEKDQYVFTYNEFEDRFAFDFRYCDLFKEAKGEVQDNLLQLTDKTRKEDYLRWLLTESITQIDTIDKAEKNFQEGGDLYDLRRATAYFLFGDSFGHELGKISVLYPPGGYDENETRIKLNEFIKIQERRAMSFCNYLHSQIKTYNINFNLQGENTIIDKFQEIEKAKEKDTLNASQQLVLLDQLGVLKNDNIQKLTTTNKGKLFGYLLNRNGKTLEDKIRNMGLKKDVIAANRNIVERPENLDVVNKILKQIGYK